MEKEQMSKKQLWILGAVIAVIAMAAATGIFLVSHFKNADSSYRSIQIYGIEGTATIEREKLGTIEAVENLYLESGDRIIVGDDSSMRLKLDDDKYILVEENSILVLVAEGTKKNSRTAIDLEQGAITNEIQNPLSEKSSYEVATPNSVMAVRGTVFRVEIIVDEKGEVYTSISAFEGKVGIRLIFPDGTVKEEDMLVEGGKEVTIHMDTEISEYLSGPGEIRYEELPVQTLIFLKEVIEHGIKLTNTTAKEIQILIDGMWKKLTGEAGEKEEEPKAETKGPEVKPPLEEPSQVPEKPKKQPVAEEPVPSPQPQPEQKPVTNQNADTQEETKRQETAEEKKEEKSSKKSNKKSTGGSGSAQGGQNETKSYTVTFLYDGQIFGTQTVEEGKTAEKPLLKPTSVFGSWDFDFTQPITADTTIEWMVLER